jgi:hypothetical protein
MTNKKPQIFNNSARTPVGRVCDVSDSSVCSRVTPSLIYHLKKSRKPFLNIVPYFWAAIAIIICLLFISAANASYGDDIPMQVCATGDFACSIHIADGSTAGAIKRGAK